MNGYGEVLYNTSRAFFGPLHGDEKYRTEGFKELALIYGTTEESYRKTAAWLNRTRHQEDGGTPSRTIRETTEHEGLMMQDYLEQKTCTIFHEHGFTPEGQPQEPMLDTIAPRTPIVEEESVTEVLLPYVLPDQCQIDMLTYPFPDEDAKEAVDMSGDGVGIKTLNELVTACGLSDQSRIDMLKNPVSYEDAKDAVNISVDDVGAKKQKETREQNPQSLRGRLNPAFDQVTSEICKNIFRHVRQEEERYWQVDEQLDEM